MKKLLLNITLLLVPVFAYCQPGIDLFHDTLSTCGKDSITLDVSEDFPLANYQYNWSTGDTTDVLTTSTENTYTIELTNRSNGSKIFDTVVIVKLPPPAIGFKDIATVLGIAGLSVAVTLTPQLPTTYNYKWHTPVGIQTFWFLIVDPSKFGIGMHPVLVEVEDHYLCRNSGTHIVCIAGFDDHPCYQFWWIGQEEKAPQKVVKLYPNPVSSVLHLETTTAMDFPVQLSVFNNLGQVVMEYQVENKKGLEKGINVSELPNGIYVIQVLSGGAIFKEAFVVD